MKKYVDFVNISVFWRLVAIWTIPTDSWCQEVFLDIISSRSTDIMTLRHHWTRKSIKLRNWREQSRGHCPAAFWLIFVSSGVGESPYRPNLMKSCLGTSLGTRKQSLWSRSSPICSNPKMAKCWQNRHPSKGKLHHLRSDNDIHFITAYTKAPPGQ